MLRPRRYSSVGHLGRRPHTRAAALLTACTLAAGGLAAGAAAAAPGATAPATATATATVPGPSALTVDHLSSPVDLEELTSPLLGWHVGSGMQTAYEVQVATTPQRMSAPDVWDSGRVSSAKNANVAYAGPALARSSGYYWRVRTWDSGGTASSWSAVATVGTGPGSTWAGAEPVWTSSVRTLDVADFTYTGTFRIGAVAASINFRESDTSNYYMWQFRTDGTLKEHKDVDGTFSVLDQPALPLRPVAGTDYDFKIQASGSTISTWIKPSTSDAWLSAGSTTDTTFASGAIGFRTGQTESFTVDDLVLTDDSGTVRYHDDFSGTVGDFAACGAVADGVQSVSASKSCGYFGPGSSPNANWAFLRGDVELRHTPITWAHLYVAASSTEPAHQFVAKTSLNGKVVGVGPSRPIGKETRYDGYDVTSRVHAGANTVSALAYTTSDQRYQAQLVVRYGDGSTSTFSTGPTWKALNGSQVLPDAGSVGSSVYALPAENFQAVHYPFGYDRPGFDDGDWPRATERPAFTDLVATPDAEVQEKLEHPTKIVEYAPGDYFVDFGRTWIGGLSLNLTGTAGQSVDIRYGQVTSAPNTVKYDTSAGNHYRDVWTLRNGSNPLETWGARVFRYVNVLGAPTGLSADDFAADAYVYPFDTSLSAFDSASDNLDQVWQLSKNTIEALNFDGYVDSYERERTFYEADDYIQTMSHLSTGGDPTLATYSTQYLLAHRTWPTEWPFYAILAMHDLWESTGDSTALAEDYSALQQRLPDAWYDDSSGLIRKTTGSNGGSCSLDCDIVDWPATDRDGFVFSPYNTVVNAIGYRAYSDMAEIAARLGKADDATRYEARASTIQRGMNGLLWDGAKGAYSDGSTDGASPISHYAVQSTAFAVAMGVAEPQQATAGAAYLSSRGMACSVYCADFMVQAAYDGDDPATGTGFMTSTATNSWMAMIRQGAGATMEAWNPAEKPNLSYSHPWASSPASNIPRYMFGIQPTSPGYDTFDVRPRPTSDVPWAHNTVPTPKGSVGAAYDVVGSRTDVGAYVPPNSTATIFVPGSPDDTVYVDGVAASGTYVDGYRRVAGVAPGCHVLTTDVTATPETDARLTTVCPAGYSGTPRWTASATYDAGVQVTDAGSLWNALWWTQNQEPGDPYGPWQEIVTASDGTAVWTASRVFEAGDVVVHDGARYKARWWTRDQEPGDPNGPWARIT